MKKELTRLLGAAEYVDPSGNKVGSLVSQDIQLHTLSALPPQTLKEARESIEREMVQEALRRHKGKVTAAALELGISRPTLYELMEKLGVAKDS